MEDRIYLNLKREEKNILIVFVERIEKIGEYFVFFNCLNFVIFIDKLVYKFYKDFIDSLQYFYFYFFDEGEELKLIEFYLKVIDYFLDRNVDRRVLFVVIGGGVVGDVVGFIVFIFKCGVKFVYIFIIFFLMVDSSIGGKIGINYKFYKN